MTWTMKITTEEAVNMIPTNRRPTHPGTILREMYMKPRNVTMRALVEATGISRKHLSRIANGRAGVSPRVAIKLAAALDTTPELWLNAQHNVDLFDARCDLNDWKPAKVFNPQDTQSA
ncbi:MAG: HigA family addiction module antitoxin [Thermodesulfobacteriota bacterium]